MPKFIYKVKKGPSKVITGRIEADSKDVVTKRLHQQGYFPLEIRIESSQKKNIIKEYFQRIKSSDIVTFTRQMADLIDSGIPVFKALNIVKEQTDNPKFSSVVEDIAKEVKEGEAFSSSLANYPDLFSDLYVALVRSGELGGNLDKVLVRLSELLEKESDLRSRVRAAMAYPILMTIVGIITVIFLISWVIPRLTYMFEEIGQILPLPTRILLGISEGITNYWWAILIIVGGLIFLYRKVSKSQGGKKILDNLKLKIPVFKNLIVKREITRFARTLGTLLESGVEMISSLKAATEVIENKVIQDQLSILPSQVRDGARLTEGLNKIKQFPILIPNMVAVGEESGHLDEILIKIANSYDRKVNHAIKTMTNLLEPTIIIVMGIIIGFIVVSMLLPIFTINFASW